MGKAISEETKQKISELYRTSDLSTSSIAQTIGVSERTAQRYKNYNGLGTSRPTSPSETSPTSPSSHDKALDITEKPRPTNQGDQVLEEPGEPSRFETDQSLDVTEKPSRTSLDNDIDEEPRQITFIGGKKINNKNENQETIEYVGGQKKKTGESEYPEDKDEFKFQCAKCNTTFDTPLEYCPGCRVPLDFPFDWYCTNCGHGFNGNLEKCPNCGESFD